MDTLNRASRGKRAELPATRPLTGAIADISATSRATDAAVAVHGVASQQACAASMRELAARRRGLAVTLGCAEDELHKVIAGFHAH